mmetsp:Transcript_16290/g.35665  ORF Transcript_16290/g.35665 Transcript_16290/m.35665 type:complete len:327 (-) Transcript_16290:492-1472(-)
MGSAVRKRLLGGAQCAEKQSNHAQQSSSRSRLVDPSKVLEHAFQGIEELVRLHRPRIAHLQQLYQGIEGHRIECLVRRISFGTLEGARGRVATPGPLDCQVQGGRAQRIISDGVKDVLRHLRSQQSQCNSLEDGGALQRRQGIVEKVACCRGVEYIRRLLASDHRSAEWSEHRSDKYWKHRKPQQLLLKNGTELRDLALKDVVNVNQDIILNVEGIAYISSSLRASCIIDHPPELAEKAADMGEEDCRICQHYLEKRFSPDVLTAQLKEDLQRRGLHMSANLRHRVMVEAYGLREDGKRLLCPRIEKKHQVVLVEHHGNILHDCHP